MPIRQTLRERNARPAQSSSSNKLNWTLFGLIALAIVCNAAALLILRCEIIRWERGIEKQIDNQEKSVALESNKDDLTPAEARSLYNDLYLDNEVITSAYREIIQGNLIERYVSEDISGVKLDYAGTSLIVTTKKLPRPVALQFTPNPDQDASDYTELEFVFDYYFSDSDEALNRVVISSNPLNQRLEANDAIKYFSSYYNVPESIIAKYLVSEESGKYEGGDFKKYYINLLELINSNSATLEKSRAADYLVLISRGRGNGEYLEQEIKIGLGYYYSDPLEDRERLAAEFKAIADTIDYHPCDYGCGY